MTDSSLHTLTCPTCGAPLQFDGVSPTIKCPFCKNVMAVPDNLRDENAPPLDSHRAEIEEIRQLARSGRMIDAIRRYRQIFEVGLKEAKDTVETLAAGGVVELPPAKSSTPRQADNADVMAEIKSHILTGNKIMAIKRYREAYDVGLKQAKDVIDQIEANLLGRGVPAGSATPMRPTPVAHISVTSSPQVTVTQQRAVKAAASAVGFSSCFGIGLTVVILLAIAIPVGFALLQPGGPIKPMLIAMQPAILIPSGQDGPPDVITLVHNVTGENRSFVRVSSATGKLLWTSQPLTGDGYADGLVASGSMFYTTNEFDLLAYNSSDGSLAWQTRMTDQLNYNDKALAVAGGRVIALTADQSMQAYDAQTGQPAWSRALRGYDRQVRLVGSQIVIIDYIGDAYDYSLIFINPADGSEQKVISPTCSEEPDGYFDETPDPDDGIIFDEAGQSIYLIYGDSLGCVQHYDLASGEKTWEIQEKDGFDISFYGFHPLLAGDKLYFGSGQKLMVLDMTLDQLKTLLDEDDYDFVPLVAPGDRLIVRARKTRGTEQFELWGLEAATGERQWQYGFENGKPIDPPNEMSGLVDNDEYGWGYQLNAQGFQLIKFQAEPSQVVLEMLNPANGTSLTQVTIPIKFTSSDFYSIPTIIGWQGQTVWLQLETKIIAIDTATGKIILTWQ